MDTKLYKCECGKAFDSPNRCNGHKGNCKVHLSLIGKNSDELYMRRGKSVSKTLSDKGAVDRQAKATNWIDEQHRCEKCGKIMNEKFGSGRFCSRSCSNSHKMTDEWRTKISNTLSNSELSVDEYVKCLSEKERRGEFVCPLCNKAFKNRNGLSVHLARCRNAHNLPKYAKIGKDELDVTVEYLTDYISSHTKCEICGKDATESIKYTGKYSSKRLCVDHNHLTGAFRGVLCQTCNRQLGWYEKYADSITRYLGDN